MKKLLKSIFSKSVIRFIRKVFPSKVQRQVDRKQAEDDKIRSVFYSQFVKANDLCFDIGANLGNRVSPLLKLGAKVVAIEPQESCYSFLKQKFGKKIKLVTKGVGAKEGAKDFYISSESPMSSFSSEWIESVKDGRFKDYTWEAPVLTEITTLDSLIKEFGTPAFVKIDVEGYEVEVLKGLNSQIKMISFEYTVPELMQNTISCLEEIEKNGSDVECNYSISETMDFASDKWLPLPEMKRYLLTKKFIETGFGDIYVRAKSNLN